MSGVGSCGAGAPAREKPEGKIIDGKVRSMLEAVMQAFALLTATLREIFDESAYQRFLEKRRLESSVNAYAAFQQENEQSKSRRPRCC